MSEDTPTPASTPSPSSWRKEVLARMEASRKQGEAGARRPVYRDVESLITPGFLSAQVAVGGVNLSLRTLYPGEYLLFRHRVGFSAPARIWKEWSVATATWVVDGQVLLEDPNAAVKVRAALQRLPLAGLDALFAAYVALHTRMGKALELIEAFCYEDHSRSLWRMAGRGVPSREGVGGLSNVSALGMNHLQRMWVAYNLAEDDRLAWNQEWAAAKLVASASSPKGIRRLSQRDEAERKMEEDRRARIILEAVREATGGAVGGEDPFRIHRAVTPEDLVEEMRRSMSGEKDLHDMVVDVYKERIRQKHEEDRAKHEARMREVEVLQGQAGVAGRADLVGHTLEQIRAIRGDEGFYRRGVVVASGSSAGRLFDKYVANDALVGGVGKDGKGFAMPPMSADNDRAGLDEAVKARRVTLSDDSRHDGGS